MNIEISTEELLECHHDLEIVSCLEIIHKNDLKYHNFLLRLNKQHLKHAKQFIISET